MSAVEQGVEVDGDRLMQFVFRAVDEVGATLNAALVVMGDRLGLYRVVAGAGGVTPAELAERTGTAERYVSQVPGAGDRRQPGRLLGPSRHARESLGEDRRGKK